MAKKATRRTKPKAMKPGGKPGGKPEAVQRIRCPKCDNDAFCLPVKGTPIGANKIAMRYRCRICEIFFDVNLIKMIVWVVKHQDHSPAYGLDGGHDPLPGFCMRTLG